jgi:glycosyltransferase involved in cell wall biosynthesis
MSAYACEPGKGSEPEVGWQWALQMARYHDVTVLTRENNRPAIEPALSALRGRQPLPSFVYHDRGRLWLDLKRRAHATQLYYLMWQRSARDVVARLHESNRYDLMHHVTFAGFRYRTAIWGHGARSIWGPVGGIESVPCGLLPWHHPVSLVREVVRNASNALQASPLSVLPKRARASTLMLVSTREMQQAFARLGYQADLMPTIGLKPADLPFQPHRPSPGPLKLLFVGNIIGLKGIDLALAALKESQTGAVLTLIGSGNYLSAAQRLAAQMGLGERVTFKGRLPREEVLKAYPDYDVFLFPSLHDTGGYAVIEAMFNELPVICLDCSGPAVLVPTGCGIKVPLAARAQVIAGLAGAIRSYDQNRTAVLDHGKAARAVVLREFDWDKKGAEMNLRYQQAAGAQ